MMNKDDLDFTFYKELVDFEQQIGLWKNKAGTEYLPTSKGIIHYSQGGKAHIIPAHPGSGTIRIEVNEAMIRCVLSVSLIDAVTQNLRALYALFLNDEILLKFFYEDSPTEEEIDLSEVISSEAIADLPGWCVKSQREVIARMKPIPKEGMPIYKRYEKF